MATGAYLDVVQLVAWARMFAGYAETMSVTEAVAQTFAPESRCHLCALVAEVRDEQQKQSPAPGGQVLEKVVLLLQFRSDAAVIPPASFCWSLANAEMGGIGREAPPLPPPRVWIG